MNNLKRTLSVLLAVMMMLVMSVPAFAASSDTGFSDVAANAWYADAVQYVRDNGLMSGTSSTTFEPETTTSRAMLATILYRAVGSPAFTNKSGFIDVLPGAYYADAVNWATNKSIVSGYGNGYFGTNDPITREQIATILWRYAGSPSADAGQNFADASMIADYAVTAVNWARANGIVSGKSGNLFDPQGNATRAQVATILHNYMTMTTGNPDTPTTDGKTLVVYFSATGSTEAVAGYIAEELNADMFKIIPANPYTSEDLNWNDDASRVVYEHEHPDDREVELETTTVENWDDYDTVLIGYPIWWGIAAWPVDSFVKSNDFSGKTVIPFCTSASSGMGDSGNLLKGIATGGDWLDGQRFSSGSSQATVTQWVDGLGH
ncbi:MAG: flavodoxin [Lachnospiraceae bacterium]|nr:flavodoxin [Lachnospiraceae bacterium]